MKSEKGLELAFMYLDDHRKVKQKTRLGLFWWDVPAAFFIVTSGWKSDA